MKSKLENKKILDLLDVVLNWSKFGAKHYGLSRLEKIVLLRLVMLSTLKGRAETKAIRNDTLLKNIGPCCGVNTQKLMKAVRHLAAMNYVSTTNVPSRGTSLSSITNKYRININTLIRERRKVNAKLIEGDSF